jgi:hypothetical protein
MKKIRMKKILVFIENDICYRHFLMNNTFKDICLNNHVKFVFPEENNKRIQNIKIKTKYFNSDVIRLHQDKRRVRTWKYLLYINQLRWRFGKQNKIIRKQRKFTLGWKAYYYFKFVGLPIIWDFYKKIKINFLEKNIYKDLNRLILNLKPDIFIHPSTLDSLYINDLIFYGKKHGIKTVVLMNSWDNPSTKNTVFNYPDMLCVWGEQTRKHALDFMNIPNKNVRIFGAAQFEAFKKNRYQNKNIFKSEYNITKQKIILYAGSSKGTNELRHLNILEEAIQNNKLSNLRVIYRPHPWGGGGLNGEQIIKKRWKYIYIEKKFEGYLKDISKGVSYKLLSNYEDTHNTLSNIDFVVSPLSTIIIEAAIHGKPSLCFLPNEPLAKHMNIEVDLIHFQDIFKSNLIYKAKSDIDLVKKINLMKENFNRSKRKELKGFSEFFVKDFKKSYSERLNEYVASLS